MLSGRLGLKRPATATGGPLRDTVCHRLSPTGALSANPGRQARLVGLGCNPVRTEAGVSDGLNRTCCVWAHEWAGYGRTGLAVLGWRGRPGRSRGHKGTHNGNGSKRRGPPAAAGKTSGPIANHHANPMHAPDRCPGQARRRKPATDRAVMVASHLARAQSAPPTPAVPLMNSPAPGPASSYWPLWSNPGAWQRTSPSRTRATAPAGRVGARLAAKRSGEEVLQVPPEDGSASRDFAGMPDAVIGLPCLSGLLPGCDT
jgi:hypothetical protein